MAGITLKKLASIQKALESVFVGDDATLAGIEKSMSGLAEAIKKGESVTIDDVNDILGDVVVEKAVEDAGGGAGTVVEADVDHPMAPVFMDLFKSLYGERIAKGADLTKEQAAFDAAFQKAAGELDGAIEGAVEATAIELGKGSRVKFGKDDGKKKPKDEEPDDDGDDDDMEKLLKGLGVPPAIVKKIGVLQHQVEALQTERDLEKFEKTAEEIGEGAKFGAELLKLHQMDPKLATSIQKRLQTKNAALRKSSHWSAELGGGSAAGEGASAYEQLDAHAKEIVKSAPKDGKKMTFAKAFVEACDAHPELYQEYQVDRRRAQSR